MGEIVFWGIIRAAVVIPLVWVLQGYMDYQLWWPVAFTCIYGIILHPAMVQYRHFLEKNKPVLEGTLCSSCRHFDKSAVLCLKHDEHPTRQYLPCDGIDWEPASFGDVDEEMPQ